MGGKQRIMALYQTQPDRSLRAKALAKEYGIGGHSHDYLDGSRGFVNHDWKGLEFDHYPDHQKITLKWAQVEQYIDLMIQSDRYLTDKEKEHYTPPAPVNAEPDVELARAKNLIREFCQEEYDSEPDFSNLSKIGVAYTNATDEEIPIQVNVDLVGYRVERYLGEVLIDERQYESLEDLAETELEALDFSELVSVTDEELEHYHSKAEERPALLPLDAATEYNALKEQHPDALVGFEQNGQFEFYADDAQKVSELLGGKLLEKETALGTVPVIGFPRDQWAHRAKQLWQCGENVYLAGLNEDGTHHQTKYLRREDYLPLGATIHMEGRTFRVDTVNFDKDSVTLQDVALAEMRMPIFREEPLALVRELYEQEQDVMEHTLPDYKVGDNVIVDFPTRTIEGKIGYVGETDVRIDTSAQGQSWDNEVINKQQFEDGLRQVTPELTDEELDALPISAVMDRKVQTFPDAATLDEALNAEPAPEPAGNFHITDDDLGVGGPKQKFARNIEAIRTLFKLEEEHRGATAEEQRVLSQYVGWGGLADAFDPGKDSWAKEYQPTHCLLENAGLNMPSVVQAEQIFTIDKSRALKYLGHLTPEEMRRVDDAVRISLALNPMGSIQQIEPIRRSTAVYAPPEVVDGKPPVYPYTPIRSSFENAGSIEEMMLYTELQSAVHAMIQRLEYSFTFNPSLLTSPKRKQQVTEILEEAEKYIWRIKEEMRCA